MNLMNKILLFLILILNVNIIFAYDDDDDFNNEFLFGLKAGLNFSTLNGEQSGLKFNNVTIIDPSSKLGGTFGAVFYYTFSKQFAVQSELLFSAKGVNFDATEYIQTWSLWYVEVPILFKSIFEMQNNMEGSVFVGPAVSYKIRSQWSDKINDVYQREDVELNGIETIDFSAVIGVSADTPMLNGIVGLDLRYTYGLSSIQKSISVSNGNISLTLYYLF